MPTYEYNGVRFSSDVPLSPDELDDITKQIDGGSSTPKETSYGDIPGQLAKGVLSAAAAPVNAIHSAANYVERKAGELTGIKAIQDAAAQDTEAAKQLKSNIAQATAPAVPTVSDVHSLPDAANYAAYKLGAVPVGAAEYAAGGLPLMAGTGALQGADVASDATGGDPKAVAAGAGTGAIVNALPVPFLRNASKSGLLSQVARGAGGMSVMGPVGAMADKVPLAVHSGNASDIELTPAEFLDAAAGGAIQGAGYGAVGAVSHPPKEPPEATPADISARNRLAQRIKDEADRQGYNLKDVDPAGEAQTTLNNVQSNIADAISNHESQLSDVLDPAKATSSADYDERVQLSAALRKAKNKVKNTVTPDEISMLERRVGDTDIGKRLVDEVRQSNHLTDIFNGGLKGGLTQYTDYFNPFAGMASKHWLARVGVQNGLTAAGMYAGHAAFGPAVPAAMLGATVTGHAVDALTGRRSKVNRFVSKYADKAAPINTVGSQPVIETRQAQALQAAQDAENARAARDTQRAQERAQAAQQRADERAARDVAKKAERDARDQARSEAKAQVQAQREAAQKAREEARAAAQAERQRQQSENAAVKAAQAKARAAAAAQAREQRQAQAQARQEAANAAMVKAATAKAVGVAVAASAKARTARAKAQYATKVQAAKAAASPKEAPEHATSALDMALRTMNQVPQGGWHRGLYERTGLLPKEVDAGLSKLVEDKAITPEQADTFVRNPEKLKKGRAAYKIADALDAMAKSGALKRDPNWEPKADNQAPEGEPQAGPSTTINVEPWSPRKAAYETAARSNQQRISRAVVRVMKDSGLTQDERAIAARAVSEIGKANNQEDAVTIRDQALGVLSREAQARIIKELDALIADKRHETRAQAEAARKANKDTE